MGNERIAGAHGVPLAGALLFAAALVCGGGQAVVLASAAPPPPAAGPAGVISASAGGKLHHQAMTAGDIYTIAGGGTGGLGDGGPATSAVLKQPGAVMVNTAGNVLIADKRIRKVAEPPAALPAAR